MDWKMNGWMPGWMLDGQLSRKKESCEMDERGVETFRWNTALYSHQKDHHENVTAFTDTLKSIDCAFGVSQVICRAFWMLKLFSFARFNYWGMFAFSGCEPNKQRLPWNDWEEQVTLIVENESGLKDLTKPSVLKVSAWGTEQKDCSNLWM